MSDSESEPDLDDQQVNEEYMYSKIDCHMKNRECPTDKFTTKSNLKKRWANGRLKKFWGSMQLVLTPDELRRIEKELLQTLSILVYISWNGWTRFQEIFNHRTDDKLPHYTLAELEDGAFLGKPWGQRFHEQQFVFSPIEIEIGQRVTSPKSFRLPLTPVKHGPRSLGMGASGQVSSQAIAPGQIYVMKDGLKQPEGGRLVFARKLILSQTEFNLEVRNLMVFGPSDSRHDRIVKFIGAIAIGNEFNILTPAADMDLRHLLIETPSEIEQHMSFLNLFEEMVHIAGALRFLHGELHTDRLRERIIHLDLKPENILVFQLFQEGSGFPVGKWIISDFGISARICDPPDLTSQDILDSTTSSDEIPTRQGIGTYLAPEAMDGRKLDPKSDIWALGCIIVQIIVRGIEGQHGLKRLDEIRLKDEYGGGNYEHDCFYRSNGDKSSCLNPHIKSWLNLLPEYPGWDSVITPKRFQELLNSVFSLDPEFRPIARNVHEDLNSLRDSLRTFSQPPQRAYSEEALVGMIKRTEIKAVRGHLMVNPTHSAGSDNDLPLSHAIESDESRILQFLLYYVSYPADVRVKNGTPALVVVAERGNLDMAKALITAGCNINAADRSGRTALMVAALHGHVEIIQFLLSQKADWEMASTEVLGEYDRVSQGYTALHYAVRWNKYQDISNVSKISKDFAALLEAFLGYGISINLPTKRTKETPLHLAVRLTEGETQVETKVKTLIRLKPDPCKADRHGYTPMLIAKENDKGYLIRMLKKYQGDIKGQEQSGRILSSSGRLQRNRR